MSVFHTFRSHRWLFSSGVSPAWGFGLFNDLFGLIADGKKCKVSKEVRKSSHTKMGSSDRVSFIRQENYIVIPPWDDEHNYLLYY